MYSFSFSVLAEQPPFSYICYGTALLLIRIPATMPERQQGMAPVVSPDHPTRELQMGSWLLAWRDAARSIAAIWEVEE